MKSLARKAIFLIAPASVGCMQIPTTPSVISPAEGRGRELPVVPPLGVTPAAATAPFARATAPQDPTKPPMLLPVPRTAEGQVEQSGPAVAVEGPLTLENLERLADRVNPSLVRDRALVEAQRGQAVQAGLWSNPRWDTNNPWVLNGRSSLLNAGYQQEIPVMGKKKLDQSAANEGIRQAELTYAQNRAALHATIRQQFYVLLVDQERVEVLTRIEELVRKSYETGLARQKAGDIGTADVKLLLVDYDRARGALRSAKAMLDGDRKQLEAMIGAPGVITGPVEGKLKSGYPEFDERSVVEYVTKNHTQVSYALSVIRQNRILLRRAEVEPFPNPTIGPAYQFGLVPGNDQFWFNCTFNIPVWDLNQGNIRAAKANLAVAAATADTTRLSLVQQVSLLFAQYNAARAIVGRFEGSGKDEPGIVANANEAARLYQIMYANKTTDLATLIQAQRTAMQANSDYVDALLNLWNAASQISGILQLERFP